MNAGIWDNSPAAGAERSAGRFTGQILRAHRFRFVRFPGNGERPPEKGGGKRERAEIQPRQETRGKRESCGPQAKTKHGKNPKNKRPPANLSQAAAKSVRLLDFLQLVAEDLADLKPFRFLRNLVFRFFGLFLRLPDAQGDPFVFFIHLQYFYFHLVPFA